MPIADEHQTGIRRYAVFTFVMDDQKGAPGSPALRFPHSPHASCLEVSTRMRQCESFFMKRLKSLEKGFIFPFVDLSFFSSYQHIEEMKKLIEPTDCINFHDAAIHLQKGCYEEVQLVDPKRDMMRTPIDDDDDDVRSGSGSGGANKTESKAKAKVVDPPGIQAGADDYKKTRGYILIAYKTMEHMYSREFLSSWKTWTGVRYVCMQMPRQLGLRRIAFYRQLSCTSDFSYVLLIEVTNLLLYAAQTLNLMNRIKLRLCGCAGVFREMEFQVDQVTASIRHITTSYQPPEKPLPVCFATPLGRLDSVESIASGQPSRKNSQAQLTNGAGAANGNASDNVDTLMQLLKEQQAAAARRKAAMDIASKAKKRQLLVPPNYPSPSVPEMATTTSAAAEVTEQHQKETSTKRAPRAQPESEDSDVANSNASADPVSKAPKTRAADRRLFQQQQPGNPTEHQMHQQQQRHQQPAYHSPAPLYPIEISTAMSASVPQAHPYFANYDQAETLPMQQAQFPGVYGQILTQPIDAILQNRQPLNDVITSYYHPVYTYTGEPVPSSPFGFVQPTAPQTPPDAPAGFGYNSPVYTRTEWKKESATYGGGAGEESIRSLAEQFRSLRETPIIGGEPTNGNDAETPFSAYQGHARGLTLEEGDENPHPADSARRERSHSAAFIEDPRRVYFQHDNQNHTLPGVIEHDRSQHRKAAQGDALQQKVQEAERLQKKIVEAGKFMEAEKLQQKIAEAESLQQKIADAERLQKKILEAERIQQKLAIAERIQQQHWSAEAERLKMKKPTAVDEKSPYHGEKAPRRQKSEPKLEDAVPMESPTFISPRRRTLPKLPPHEASISDEEMEVEPKRHREKRDRALPTPQKPAQHLVSPKADSKEAVAAERQSRQRPRNGTSAEKHKQKEHPEKVQQQTLRSQLQPVQKQEQPSGNGSSKISKASSASRSRRADSGGDAKTRQASSSSNGRRARSPPETAAAKAGPATETSARHEKSRAREANGSRSRSRDDLTNKATSTKPSTSTTHEAASTSSADRHQKTKPSESASTAAATTAVDEQQSVKSKSATTSKSGHAPGKGHQSPKKRKQ